MKYQPKFKAKEPTNKEEKLICELSKDLHDCSFAYIKLNAPSCKDHEVFITLRDGALAFAGQTIHALLAVMADNTEKFGFLKECQDIFNSYIQQASEDIK